MERIASFSIDHDRLSPGFYLSRRDLGVDTWDLRVVNPNAGNYPSNAAMHSLEHIFATLARNHPEFGQNVVYFGPMGCRTGFYLLTAGLSALQAITLTRDCLRAAAEFSDPVPGASRTECGNWLEHDAGGARAVAARMVPILEGWTPERTVYPR